MTQMYEMANNQSNSALASTRPATHEYSKFCRNSADYPQQGVYFNAQASIELDSDYNSRAKHSFSQEGHRSLEKKI